MLERAGAAKCCGVYIYSLADKLRGNVPWGKHDDPFLLGGGSSSLKARNPGVIKREIDMDIQILEALIRRIIREEVSVLLEEHTVTWEKKKKKPTRRVAEMPVEAFPPPSSRVSLHVWNSYVDHRKAKRAPITLRAYYAICELVGEIVAAGDDPNEAIMMSVRNGWTGIFAENLRKKKRERAQTHSGIMDWITDQESEKPTIEGEYEPH